MESDLVVEFLTKEDANIYADKLHAENLKYTQKLGYAIIDGEIVGKNAATGEDDPSAQRTVTWCSPKQIDGKYYIPEPSGARFDEAKTKGDVAVLEAKEQPVDNKTILFD